MLNQTNKTMPTKIIINDNILIVTTVKPGSQCPPKGRLGLADRLEHFSFGENSGLGYSFASLTLNIHSNIKIF